MKANPIYGHHVMVMLLVVHLIIGHRRLRDVDYYRDDEMVKRVLGLKRIAGRVHRQPLARQCRCTKRRQSPSRVEHCGHGALGGRTIRERNARLRRLGVEHRAPCRRHGSGVQQEKERCAQLLPPVLHRRPDRPSARCASSARQCPRLQRCRHLHRALCAYRAREPASGKDRGPYRQRVLQPSHRRSTSLLGGQVHHLGAVRALCRSQRNGRRQTTMASHGGRARLFRDPLEAEVVEHPLSLHLHQKTRPMPEQSSHSTRSVSAHRIWIRGSRSS